MTSKPYFLDIICWEEETTHVDKNFPVLEKALNYLCNNANSIHEYFSKTKSDEKISPSFEDITTIKVHYFPLINAVTVLQYREHINYDLDLEKNHSLREGMLNVNCKDENDLVTLTNSLLELMRKPGTSLVYVLPINNPD